MKYSTDLSKIRMSDTGIPNVETNFTLCQLFGGDFVGPDYTSLSRPYDSCLAKPGPPFVCTAKKRTIA